MSDAAGRRHPEPEGRPLPVHIERAEHDDAAELHALRMRVFREVARQYSLPDLPPLKETETDVRAEIDHDVVLQAVTRHGHPPAVVGTIGVRVTEDAVMIRRLVVDRRWRGLGIGAALAEEADRIAATKANTAGLDRIELFTGELSHASLAIWRSLGYRESERRPGAGEHELVFLRRIVA